MLSARSLDYVVSLVAVNYCVLDACVLYLLCCCAMDEHCALLEGKVFGVHARNAWWACMQIPSRRLPQRARWCYLTRWRSCHACWRGCRRPEAQGVAWGAL